MRICCRSSCATRAILSDVLLIHGSCHGAWCWRDLVPALARLGHTARTIDLPGHNDGRAPETVTLEETCRAVADAASAETVIVGHSWGGFPITGAVDVMPKGPRALVYLCSYIPADGLSLIEMRRAGPRQTIGGAAQKSGDGHSYSIVPSQAPDLFYQDCAPEIVEFALPRLCPQPIKPQDTPLARPARWDGIPKAYIRCAQDRTIPREYQATMAEQLPSEMRFELDCGHSPFFAAPVQTAAVLDQIMAALPKA